MEVFHFYDFIVMAVFILLVVLSLNEIVLVQLERDLGNHMVIEHMLFFSIGALSVFVAERILRFMISIEKKSLSRTKSGILYPSSRATMYAIQYWNNLPIKHASMELDSYHRFSHFHMAYTSNF